MRTIEHDWSDYDLEQEPGFQAVERGALPPGLGISLHWPRPDRPLRPLLCIQVGRWELQFGWFFVDDEENE